MRQSKWILSAMVVACFGFVGCQMSPVQKGGLAGAAVGAAVGGLWAANAGILNAGEGAAVGAAVGTAGGALAADALADKETSDDSDALNAENESLNKKLDLKDKRIGDLEKQLDEMADQIKRMPKPDQVSKAPPAATDEEVRDLQQAVGGQVEVGRNDKGITLTFVSEILFASGRAQLTKTGIKTLKQAAQAVRERYPNNEICVEGHTDNVPIKYSGYRSNWELSADRAAAVLHFLVDKEGFRPELLSVAGYADTRPVAPNDTALGRRLNRRAVIVIMPDIKYQKEHLSL